MAAISITRFACQLSRAAGLKYSTWLPEINAINDDEDTRLFVLKSVPCCFAAMWSAWSVGSSWGPMVGS